jgi:hypothetical protein
MSKLTLFPGKKFANTESVGNASSNSLVCGVRVIG